MRGGQGHCHRVGATASDGPSLPSPADAKVWPRTYSWGRPSMWRTAVMAGVLSMVAAAGAAAQLAVSANDAKVKLIDGKVVVEKEPSADTVSIIDLRANPPKLLAEIEVPNSVVGPPLNRSEERRVGIEGSQEG